MQPHHFWTEDTKRSEEEEEGDSGGSCITSTAAATTADNDDTFVDNIYTNDPDADADADADVDADADADPSLSMNNNNNHHLHLHRHLDNHIKLLYALNGLIEVLPNLAMLSLINDRVKLPAQYIPPYYAIEFLPYSLKPLYALSTYWITAGTEVVAVGPTAAAVSVPKVFESELNSHSNLHLHPTVFHEEEGEAEEGNNIITNGNVNDERINKGKCTCTCKRNIKIQRHWLLACLQLCASLSIGLTAFLPANAILPCFIMGFLRGFTISWAEFLNGLALISSVRERQLDSMAQVFPVSTMDCNNDNNVHVQRTVSSHQEIFDNNNNNNNNNRRNEEETLLSLFQSNAATYRNIGASIGEVIVFSIIFGRKYFISHGNDEGGNGDGSGNGSDSGALSDLFVTMMLLGSAMVPLTASFVALKGKVGTAAINHYHYYGRHRYTGGYSQHHEQQQQRQQQNNGSGNDMNGNNISNNLRRRGYNPVSVDYENIHSSSHVLGTLPPPPLSSSSSSYSLNKSHTRHVKRVGLYLILRHAMPSSNGLIASFEYTIFRTRPLYIQLKSFLLSITAVLSTWTYGRLISKKYVSIKHISRAIIVATIVLSLWSMMFLPFYESFRKGGTGAGADAGADISLDSGDDMMRTATAAITAGGGSINNDTINSTSTNSDSANDDDDENDDSISFHGSIWLLVSFAMFQLFGSFLSEISFLPSVVLATNTIVHSVDDNDETTVVLNGNGHGHGIGNGIENENESNDNYDESTSTGSEGHNNDHDGDNDNNNNINNNEDMDMDIDNYFDQHQTKKPWYLDDGILYGIMISCIDFGDQLGGWFAAPLVRMLNISRENNWDNLNWFVVICSMTSIASLGFLRILWYRSKPVDR